MDNGKKIKIATGSDYILGVVSANPSTIGNSDEDWNGRWQCAEFGRFKVNNNQLVQNADYDRSK